MYRLPKFTQDELKLIISRYLSDVEEYSFESNKEIDILIKLGDIDPRPEDWKYYWFLDRNEIEEFRKYFIDETTDGSTTE